MNKILFIIIPLVVTASLCQAENQSRKPLIPWSNKWPMNEYCKQRKIGDKDFYIGARGPYAFRGKEFEAMKTLGLDRQISPGWMNPWSFRKGAKNDAYYQRVVDIFNKNNWPFFSICYHANRAGVPAITDEDRNNKLWLGDGHPEYSYRLEPILSAARGEKSTWLPDSQKFKRNYYVKHALPEIKKELPFYNDPKHRWTRHDYYVLSKILQNVTFREVGLENALPWGMRGIGFYYVASQPGNRVVGNKVPRYFNAARSRGAMRQFGGNKFWIIYPGFEPLVTMTPSMHKGRSHIHGVNTESGGFPYTHCRIYLYWPYLAGVNLYANEGFVYSLFDDVEKDGHFELSPGGHVFREMLDFTHRHPDRGSTYAPIALLMDWEMTRPMATGTTYGQFLPFEDCDQMNYGLLFDLLYPNLRKGGGDYFCTTPFGDIFDILKPNVPGKGLNPKVLENYKVLFALGGLKIDRDLAKKITDFVEQGGAFVVNVKDCDQNLSSKFLGVKIEPETIEGTTTISKLSGKKFVDQPFDLRKMKLDGAKTIYSDEKGNPVITRYKYGKGYVFVVAAEYMIEKKGVKATGTRFESKRVLSFTRDFLDHLIAGLMPVEVIIPKDSRKDIGWSVAKKGDGWVVNMINYSFEQDQVKLIQHNRSHVEAIYPPKKVPVKLDCHFPVKDALEWIDDRNVEWRIENGNAVIDTSIASGEIKVIEIQPKEIELKPVQRFVNYALNRPVKVTSEAKGHEGKQLVDGDTGRLNGWWSKDRKNRHSDFILPQSAIVCLEEVREIDHIELLFYYWRRERPEKYGKTRFTRFLVETSLDGKKWEIAFDERKNAKTAVGFPLERWFKPRKALYVKLTVTENSTGAGAQVIEMKVFGKMKAPVKIKRKPANPGKISFPIDLKSLNPKNIVYLTNTPYQSAKTGWLPVGKTIKDMAGSISLKATEDDLGKVFNHSLYAQANSEYIFKLDDKYKYFLAVVGFGAMSNNGFTVEFEVFVDGKKKYDSGPFKKGVWPKAVFVDVTGGKELRLVVNDSGDGIRNDYAWWGNARLVKK